MEHCEEEEDCFDGFVPDTLDAIAELSEECTDSSMDEFITGTTTTAGDSDNLLLQPAGFGTLPKDFSQLDRTCPDIILEEGTENEDSSNVDSACGGGAAGTVSELPAPMVGNPQFGFSISPVKSPMRSPKPRPTLSPIVAAETQVFDGNGSIMMFDFDGDSSDSSFNEATATNNKLPKTLPMMADCDEDELSWRLDPSRSMSDWTITVNNLNTRLSKNYFVHKNMLAVGKRKSPYFVDVFKTKLREASSERMTELFFPALAAEAMPVLLDYIYVGESVLELSSTSAPGLRYLAQFFGIRILFEEIMKFIQADLSLNTLTSYYKAGVGLEDRKVLNVVSKHIVRNIALIEESHDIVETMEPSFFMKILASSDLSSPANMVHTSILLAKYCGLWKKKLDKATFLELTSEKILGHIYHGAALPLLEIESDLGIHGEGTAFTCLQERCIASLAPKWDSLCDVDPGRTRDICNKLPTRVITEIMMKSLTCAKRQNEKEVRALRSSETEKRNYITSRMKSDYDKLVDELRSICGDKDRMIKMYAMELSRFRRVPNSTNSKLVPSGRSNKQTVAPEIAKFEMEGYLLVNKKQIDKYPVFYYR